MKYLLSYKPGIQLAIVEAKDNNHSIGSGIRIELLVVTVKRALSKTAR